MEEEKESIVLPLVFSITSGLALFGLTVFIVIATHRRQLPQSVRIFLYTFCVGGTAGLIAYLLCHFALTTKAYQLAQGDQLELSQYKRGHVYTRLHTHFCQALQLTSDKPGIRVWTASLSLNRGEAKTYALNVHVSKRNTFRMRNMRRDNALLAHI